MGDIVRANIRRRRRELGLRQHAMARALGVTQGRYSNLETGRTEITMRKLALIALRLHVEPWELLHPAGDIDAGGYPAAEAQDRGDSRK